MLLVGNIEDVLKEFNINFPLQLLDVMGTTQNRYFKARLKGIHPLNKKTTWTPTTGQSQH